MPIGKFVRNFAPHFGASACMHMQKRRANALRSFREPLIKSARADSEDFFVSAKERKVEEYWMYFPLSKGQRRRKKTAAPPQTIYSEVPKGDEFCGGSEEMENAHILGCSRIWALGFVDACADDGRSGGEFTNRNPGRVHRSSRAYAGKQQFYQARFSRTF